MKTINLIIPNFIPDNLAGTNRMKIFVKILSKKHKINIITLTKQNQESKVKDIFKDYNVKFYFIENDKFFKDNFIKRALNEIYFSKKLVFLSKKIEADIIIATSPTMFIIPMLLLDKRRKIIDIRDLVWEYIDNRFIKIFLKVVMKFSLKFYDKIVVTNEFEKKLLSQYNPILISNGIEKEKFDILSNLDLKFKKFSVTYIGNIGIAQNIMTLLEVAKELKNIEFKIVGNGVDYEKIKQYIKNNNLKNVILYGKKEWNEILDIYQNSTILWAQLMGNFKYAMPSKLYEYLSTGLPVVYGGEGVAKEFLQNYENSFIYEPGNSKALKEILVKLQDYKFKKSLTNIQMIEKNYIREKSVLKLLDILKGLK